MEQCRVFREQEHAPGEPDAIGDLVYDARAETLDHASEDAGRGKGSQAMQGAGRDEARRSWPGFEGASIAADHLVRESSARDRGGAHACHGSNLWGRAVRAADEASGAALGASPYLAFRKKGGIVPRRAGPTWSSGPSALPINGLRTIRGRSDSFADSE
jgi:hypothetical protein